MNEAFYGPKVPKKGIMTPKKSPNGPKKRHNDPKVVPRPKIVLNIFEGLTLLNDRLVLPPQVQDKIK